MYLYIQECMYLCINTWLCLQCCVHVQYLAVVCCWKVVGMMAIRTALSHESAGIEHTGMILAFTCITIHACRLLCITWGIQRHSVHCVNFNSSCLFLMDSSSSISGDEPSHLYVKRIETRYTMVCGVKCQWGRDTWRRCRYDVHHASLCPRLQWC